MFLPGESQGRGSLVGWGLWGRTESDTTEVTQQHGLISDSTSSDLKVFTISITKEKAGTWTQ